MITNLSAIRCRTGKSTKTIDQLEIIDIVLGTHASGSFLVYLAFNKYVPEFLFIVRCTDYPVNQCV